MLSGIHIFVTVGIALCAYVVHAQSKPRRLRLPPGPRKLPLIGNLLDMPGGRAWLSYAKMCRDVGSDIIHLSAMGQNIIVLNTAELVNELMEKKSAIYSSRAQLTMLHEMIGWKFSFSFGPYDGFWKAQRRAFTQAVNPSNATLFHPQQLEATHELLRRLLHSTDVMHDLHHWSAVTIMDITYGIHGNAADPYIATAVEALDSLATAGAPGAFLVDTIPLLKYIPEWVPGARFKKKAREWSILRQNMTEKPFEDTKRQMETGVYRPSLTSNALESLDKVQDASYQEDVIKGAAVTAYGGGSDTVVAALSAFLLAMLFHPEIQAKAQQELDKILGPGDLPTFRDESSLPYISAIVKEVLRHNPVTPLAIPHLLMEDDTHDGYWLPKGSIVIANAWSILHDEEAYPDPMSFNPDRFLTPDGKLNPDVKDPGTAAFGFGRRTCPGRHVAISSLWIAMASILATYNITKAVDRNGRAIEVSGDWFSGPTLFNRPLPFQCRFVPRSKAAEVSILATANGVVLA